MTLAPISFYRIHYSQIDPQDICVYCQEQIRPEDRIAGHRFTQQGSLTERVHAFHFNCLQHAVVHQPGELSCPLCFRRITVLSQASLVTGQLPLIAPAQQQVGSRWMNMCRAAGFLGAFAHIGFVLHDSFRRGAPAPLGIVAFDVFHLFLFYYYLEIRSWINRFR